MYILTLLTQNTKNQYVRKTRYSFKHKKNVHLIEADFMNHLFMYFPLRGICLCLNK